MSNENNQPTDNNGYIQNSGQNPNQNMNGYVQSPNQNMNGYVQNPNQNMNGYVQSPNQNMNGYVQNPNQNMNGYVQSPNQNMSGYAQNPNPNMNGYAQNPNTGAAGNWQAYNPANNFNPNMNGYVQNPNPNMNGYPQSPNPNMNGYAQSPNPNMNGYVQNPNQNMSGYVQNPNPNINGYVQSPNTGAAGNWQAYSPAHSSNPNMNGYVQNPNTNMNGYVQNPNTNMNAYAQNPNQNMNGYAQNPNTGAANNWQGYNGPNGPAGPAKKNPDNTESVIGKYALPIFATILILAGICFFAVTLWKDMPDIVKAMIVMGGAVIIAAVGLIFGRKENMRTFRISMIAIAFSVIFIDLLCMYYAWEIMSALLLIITIIAWCCLAVLFSFLCNSPVFHYCSLCGLVIAALILDFEMEVSISYFVVIWALFLTLIMLAVTHRIKFRNCQFIFAIAGSLIFSIISMTMALTGFMFKDDSMRLFVRLSIYLLAIIFALLYRFIAIEDSEKIKSHEHIINGLSAFMTGISVMALSCTNLDLHSMLEAVSVMLLAIAFCIFNKTRLSSICGSILPLFITCCVISDYYFDMISPGAVMIEFIILLIFALKDSVVSRILAITALGLVQFMCFTTASEYYKEDEELTIFIILCLALVTSLCIQFIFMARKQRAFYSPSLASNTIFFLTTFIYADTAFFDRVHSFSTVGFYAAFILIFVTMLFSIRHTSEQASRADLYVHTIIFNFIVIMCFTDTEYTPVKVLLGILLALIIVSICILYEKAKCQRAATVSVVSTLFTIDYLVVVYSTALRNYAFIISIGLLLIATALIIYGFAKRSKTARIYGLVLVFISVAKMLLLDISTNNTLIRVASLIGGGIICLIISFVYNKMAKALNE
ncbi:MAG: DUF2339 domain-containing protein [Lachnospiraceae bacterium]|nr:DUF2339 domain-containing protein [Lachnospiraceae bacterium]